MKPLENKLPVASSAALLLSVVKSLYTDGWGYDYLSRIDFSAVEKPVAALTSITPLFSEILLLRKQMVRYLIKQLMIAHPHQQVCILAAGLDPLGLQIAEYFPEQLTSIYEIDICHMQEKQALYAAVSYNDVRLHTLHADITHTAQMMKMLIAAGYQPKEPTLIVFEGIMHYIPEEQFLNVMRCFCSRVRNNAVIMDYALPEEEMPASYISLARALSEVMENNMVYSRKKVLNLLSLLEAEIAGVYDMQATEYLLHGYNKWFRGRGEGLLEIAAFHI
ncbi:class I SAM-dependent methyltransferase [Chitinophaga sp.]|uniref:class I SAM-dependent methyltransferase n=1 Tax=Chitinophaga sp. TaxID=1869181 RepID=UPI0031D9724F